MKAGNLNLAEEIRFEPDKGLVSFQGNRLVIFEASAMGLLRQELISAMGWDQARTFMLRFGYQNGMADYLKMRDSGRFDDERELLLAGPVLHSWEGIVQAVARHIEFDREAGEFEFTGVWHNSYEADQHLQHQHLFFDGIGDGPVCWSLMGYASGWSTAFFGQPLVAIEPLCRGKGDDHCEWLIKPPSKWGKEAKPYIDALKGFWDKDNLDMENPQ